MNLKRELQKMNISDLRGVCNELGVSCSKNKKSIIKKLLSPLKRRYKKNTDSGGSKNFKRKKRKVINPLPGLITTDFIINPVDEKSNNLISNEEINEIFKPMTHMTRVAYSYIDLPYVCEKCKLGWKGQSGLWYHQRQKHGKKTFTNKKRKTKK